MTSEYSFFDPRVSRPLHELPRVEAIAAYDWFISQKDDRKRTLLSHARELGVDIRDDERESIELLHQFLVSEIQKEGCQEAPSAYVYSLCNDIAILMSDMLIQKAPHLSWGIYTAGRNDLSYQRPVIRGFNVKNKNYSVDIDYLLCQYAHRLCAGGAKEEGLLWSIYSSALAKA